ncbi:hypothetical protein ABPG74_019313, partial [Tetrahymena malaccensis]
SFQTHFNQQSNEASPQNQNKQQQNKFVLLNSHDLKQSNIGLKKFDSFKKMRDKWTYYTRLTKQSPLIYQSSQDQVQLDTQQSKQYDYDNQRIITNASCTNSDKIQIELVNNDQ